MIRASVVIATFNRRALLGRLLSQLAAQTLPAWQFEVVVVDDGSREPVAPALEGQQFPFSLTLERQENAGAAAARHRGVLKARGEVLVIVDDDMQVRPDLLERHLEHHGPGKRRVVIGRIAADPAVGDKPLFERWHQRVLDDLARDASDGTVMLRGNHLYTGNVSLRREDYLAVGGFDPSLGHSEDAELGLRLERAGASFVFAPEAVTLHGSDHTDLDKWRARARQYGAFDRRIALKHPDLGHASPWRFLFQLNPAARPFLGLSVLAPVVGTLMSKASYGAARLADRLGFERGALAGTTLSYGLEYFRGLREEAGPLSQVLGELAGYGLFHGALPLGGEALAQLQRDAFADFEVMTRYQARYDERDLERAGPLNAAVTKIGYQWMLAYRLMRAFHASGRTRAAQVTSRLMRLAFGSDVHWEADLKPGVMIVHGMGLALSRAATVGHGCILFQHVTLGLGTDPDSRRFGAPTLEEDVHVGPGATLLGPIVIGAGSKIMAGAVVTRSVPPGSLVESPQPTVAPRVKRPEVVRAPSAKKAAP